jgi:hypothetical protein
MWICRDVPVNICNIQNFYLLLNYFIFTHFDCVNYTAFLVFLNELNFFSLHLDEGI